MLACYSLSSPSTPGALPPPPPPPGPGARVPGVCLSTGQAIHNTVSIHHTYARIRASNGGRY
eukprot:scaffold26372_cov120-Isochrysis_galbana.AAC.6